MPTWSSLLRCLYPVLLLPFAAPSPAMPPELDQRLAALARSGDFAGAVVIRRRGQIVYERGFGLADVEAGLAFSTRTVVETGSVTKPVTAAAVLLLAENGRLHLDDAVRTLIPEFPHGATTIRHLLTHGAGLPDYSAFESELNSGRLIETPDLLRFVASRHQMPVFPSGSRFSYCNICFDTLALIVERVSGQSYAEFVRNHFFEPSGARRVFLRPARLGDWNGFRVRGYRRTATGFEPNDVFDNEGFYGGGNLYFSADDLAAWMSAWSEPKQAIGPIRSAATTPVAFPDGRSGLTLGNFYCSESRTRCYYPGHHQGFHAFGYWDSERRLAIAFVSNGTLAPSLQVDIPRLLIAAAEGRPIPALSPPAASPPVPLQPGSYHVGSFGRVTLSSEGGSLVVKLPGRTAYPLVPAGHGWAYAPGLDLYVRGDGSDGLILHSIFAVGRGRRLD